MPLQNDGIFVSAVSLSSSEKDDNTKMHKVTSTLPKSPAVTVIDGLIEHSPIDDPVYAFMDKKRAQGKPYYVSITTGANKLLRIYYGCVRESLASFTASTASFPRPRRTPGHAPRAPSWVCTGK